MKVIIRPRRAGKTVEAIKLAAEHGYYIVVPNQVQARDVMKRAQEMSLNIPLPITWNEFTHQQYYGRHIKGFVIDNLDMCLRSMSSVPIELVTLNVVTLNDDEPLVTEPPTPEAIAETAAAEEDGRYGKKWETRQYHDGLAKRPQRARCRWCGNPLDNPFGEYHHNCLKIKIKARGK
jgi:hypothetical protein